jgi:hypothetical protein
MADTVDDLTNELLTGAMEELDLPRSVELTMHAIYDDVGRWMGETLGEGDWAIYSQGSSRLGTMVRPEDGSDFDIDSVVVRDLEKTEITQQELKDEVGDALDKYVKARASTTGAAPTGCQESRRCWTLSFNEPFHMDVLPAIPDATAAPTGILLPDRELLRWQFGDPIGYSDWFFGRMADDFQEQRTAVAKQANVDVEDVPRWRIRTTLQRMVQAFKAHRNNYFAGHDAHRPPSILITTLTARAYRGERQLVEGVMNAASRMPGLVERDGDGYVVLNPVQDRENFADMWTPTAAARFFEWMNDLQATLDDALKTRSGVHAAVAILERKFGVEPVQKSASRFGAARNAARNDGRLKVAATGAVGAAGFTVRPHIFHGA